MSYDPEMLKNYRRDEMHPDLAAVFERAFKERGTARMIPKFIDEALDLQKSRSVFTACNYIRYLLLHELSWIDVFGKQAREFDRHIAHFKQCEEMEKKIDDLTETVNEMSDQMEQMQTMLMNMANMLIDRGMKVKQTA